MRMSSVDASERKRSIPCVGKRTCLQICVYFCIEGCIEINSSPVARHTTPVSFHDIATPSQSSNLLASTFAEILAAKVHLISRLFLQARG